MKMNNSYTVRYRNLRNFRVVWSKSSDVTVQDPMMAILRSDGLVTIKAMDSRNTAVFSADDVFYGISREGKFSNNVSEQFIIE